MCACTAVLYPPPDKQSGEARPRGGLHVVGLADILPVAWAHGEQAKARPLTVFPRAGI